jgi:hypothetical protein
MTAAVIAAKQCPICGNHNGLQPSAQGLQFNYCDHFVGWSADGETVTTGYRKRVPENAEIVKGVWQIVFDMNQEIGRVYKP